MEIGFGSVYSNAEKDQPYSLTTGTYSSSHLAVNEITRYAGYVSIALLTSKEVPVSPMSILADEPYLSVYP